MQFEFESECGLKVIHTPDGLRCVLSEVDARIHGRAAYYAPLPKQHDPTEAIHQAGWDEYDYYLYEWEEKGRQAQVQLADLFGVCLYMATIPKDKASRRRSVYSSVCQTLEVSEVGPYELMDQVGFELTWWPCYCVDFIAPLQSDVSGNDLLRITCEHVI